MHTLRVVKTPTQSWCQEALREHCIPFPKNWIHRPRPDGAADDPEPAQGGPFRHGVEPHGVARGGVGGRGAKLAKTPREAAAASDILFTIVSDPPALEEILWGHDGKGDGALAGLHSGA